MDIQSEPLDDTPYAHSLPSSLKANVRSATVPSSLDAFMSRNARGGELASSASPPMGTPLARALMKDCTDFHEAPLSHWYSTLWFCSPSFLKK